MSQPEQTTTKEARPSVAELVREMVPEHAHRTGGPFRSTWKWSTPAGWWELEMSMPFVSAGYLALRGSCTAALPYSFAGLAAARALLVALGGLPPKPPAAERPGWWGEGCRCTVTPEVVQGTGARVVRLNGCPLHSAVGEP